MAIYKSKFTGQEIDDILTNASNVTNIEANPSGEATEELTKLTIGGTTYSIPEGTVVEGNPSGDATVELTKLKIGDTIYSIPQGSGGGGTQLYKHTVVCSNATVYIISTVGTQATGAIDFESAIPSLRGYYPNLAYYGNLLIFSYREGDTPSAIRNQKIYGAYIDVNATPRVFDFGTFVSDTVTPI